MHRLATAVAVLALSAACSSSGGGGSDDGACNHAVAGLCNEYHGVPSGGWPSLANQCTANGGTASQGGTCPTASRVGCCKYPGTGGSYSLQCSYAPRTAADESVCTSGGGAWTAG